VRLGSQPPGRRRLRITRWLDATSRHFPFFCSSPRKPTQKFVSQNITVLRPPFSTHTLSLHSSSLQLQVFNQSITVWRRGAPPSPTDLPRHLAWLPSRPRHYCWAAAFAGNSIDSEAILIPTGERLDSHETIGVKSKALLRCEYIPAHPYLNWASLQHFVCLGPQLAGHSSPTISLAFLHNRTTATLKSP
jgi:hypothetical protein